MYAFCKFCGISLKGTTLLFSFPDTLAISFPSLSYMIVSINFNSSSFFEIAQSSLLNSATTAPAPIMHNNIINIKHIFINVASFLCLFQKPFLFLFLFFSSVFSSFEFIFLFLLSLLFLLVYLSCLFPDLLPIKMLLLIFIHGLIILHI